jgi:hypothetical protein
MKMIEMEKQIIDLREPDCPGCRRIKELEHAIGILLAETENLNARLKNTEIVLKATEATSHYMAKHD